MRKLRVGNKQNENHYEKSLQSDFCSGNPSTGKISQPDRGDIVQYSWVWCACLLLRFSGTQKVPGLLGGQCYNWCRWWHAVYNMAVCGREGERRGGALAQHLLIWYCAGPLVPVAIAHLLMAAAAAV